MPDPERENRAGEHARDPEGDPEGERREKRDPRLPRREEGGGRGWKTAQRLRDPPLAQEEG